MARTGKDSLAAANEILAFARGEDVPGLVVHIPPEIDAKAIRERAGVSQEEFATAFGVSVDLLRAWEQGRRVPQGPARVLLAL